MSRHGFRLVVFDFDGTLADSQHFIHQAYSAAFREQGLTPPAPAATRNVVGLRLEEATGRLLDRSDDDALVKRIAEGYRQAFFRLRQAPDFEEPLFPGVRETLDLLAVPEVCLGIATGKARRGLLACLDHHGLTEHFFTLQTADDGPGKPHPALLQQAMAASGAACEETVFIGDTSYDMEMAVNAGVVGLGVAWGYHESVTLSAAGAAAIVDSFADLPSALTALRGAER